ncbi:MAG: hypothetical protein J7M13_04665 [Synergistetes bacterium]|nr:hypothetical protein [Synergistota bacterium]
MEDSILDKRKLLWIGIGLGVVFLYVLMLISDLSLHNEGKDNKEIEGLSMQEVFFWKELKDNRILEIYAMEMNKTDDSVRGKDISLRLLEKGNGRILLLIKGTKGAYDINKGMIFLDGGITGVFRKLKWRSDSLVWNLMSDKVKGAGNVSFRIDGWKGSASKLSIDVVEKVFEFKGNVNIMNMEGK